jgi:ferredoxin
VVDIYALSRPQLNIVDGVVGMDGNGPSAGNPKELGIILASEDGVALDSFICHILGKEPLKIPINQIAHEQNLGETTMDNIHVLGEIPPIKDFKWPSGLVNSLDMIPAPLARSLMKLFWSRPAIDPENCIKCGNCIKSCPVDALTTGAYIPEFDYDKCISCLCCMEMCPEKAVYLNKSLIFRIFSHSD